MAPCWDVFYAPSGGVFDFRDIEILALVGLGMARDGDGRDGDGVFWAFQRLEMRGVNDNSLLTNLG